MSIEQFGKYHIHSELGKGGFATVYRAVDTTLDRAVALKVLDPLLMRDATWAERFRREAKTIATLKHPAIVSIYEVNEVEGRLYLAMELAGGGSLAGAIAARGRLPWAETLALLKPVCEALDYAHGQGVIHRDLKPANILLTAEGQPLLTDFGFARLLGDNSMSLSISGGILGTPAYIAPEIWEGKLATPATDVYALGCVLFEMLTGAVLFKGDTTPAVMRAHFLPHEYPVTWPEDVPPEVQSLLERALYPDPAARYAKAGDFAATLRHLAEHAAAEAARRTAEAQAQAERARWAAQWRAEAESALQAGQWDAARIAAQKWLEMAPGDAAAKALLTEATRRMGVAACPMGADRNVRPTIPIWICGVGALLLVIVIGSSQILQGGTVPTRVSLTATTISTVIPSLTITPMPTNTLAPTTIPTAMQTKIPTQTKTSVPTATATPTPLPLPEIVNPDDNAGYYTTNWVPLDWEWSQKINPEQRFVVVIQNMNENVLLRQVVEYADDSKLSFRAIDLGLGAGSYTWFVQIEEYANEEWIVVIKSQSRTLRIVKPQPTAIPTPNRLGDTWVGNFRVLSESPPEACGMLQCGRMKLAFDYILDSQYSQVAVSMVPRLLRSGSSTGQCSQGHSCSSYHISPGSSGTIICDFQMSICEDYYHVTDQVEIRFWPHDWDDHGKLYEVYYNERFDYIRDWSK